MTRKLLALVLLTGLAGCTGFDSVLDDADNARVAEVQAIYDAEFRTAVAADGLNVQPGRFDETLSALPTTSSGLSPAVAGFYTLLEGLIYLQTGQLGQAALIAPDVTAAAPKLNAGGIERRNGILAENYADLVAGREAGAALAQLTSNSATDNAQRVEVVRQIDDLTASVTRRLCQTGSSEGDDGKAFVAAYQATALVQADRALERACLPTATDADLCAGFFGGRQQLQDARDLMTTFSGSVDSASSQINRIQSSIESDLVANQDGAPPTPPRDVCS